MIRVSFFNKETGEIHPKQMSSSNPDQISINVPPGHDFIEGHYDANYYRVDPATRQVVEHRPPAPSGGHVWDMDLKRWILTDADQLRQQRRASALAQIAALETTNQPRALREVALSLPGSLDRLQEIDNQIAALRASLKE